MATTINNIKVDFGLGAQAPRVTFLQGCNMKIPTIRETLRQIEESSEGRGAPGAVSGQGTGFGWICRSSGNFPFTDTETSALTIEIMPPFDIFFEAGGIPFQTSEGNLLGTFANSPGAIVQINNAVGATNVDSSVIQYSSFNGQVAIQQTGGTPGTVYPQGTRQSPIDNLADVLTVNNVYDFGKIEVIGDLELVEGDDVSGMTLTGHGASFNSSNTTITMTYGISAGPTTSNTIITDARVEGYQGGEIHYKNAVIGNISNTHCFFEECGMVGPVTITDSLWGPSEAIQYHTTYIRHCYSGKDGYTLDYNNSPINQVYIGWSGDINFQNITDPRAEIDIRFGDGGGKVTFEASCTALDESRIKVSGIGEMDNLGTGSVDTSALVNSLGSAYGKIVFLSETEVGNMSGTEYPAGLFTSPSSNMTDALALMNKFSCNTLHIHSSTTLLSGQSIDFFKVEGHMVPYYILTCEPGCSTEHVKFFYITITGTLSDECEFTKNHLMNITGLDGYAEKCSLMGTNTLLPSGSLNLSNCRSATQMPTEIVVGDAAVTGTGWNGMMVISGKVQRDAYDSVATGGSTTTLIDTNENFGMDMALGMGATIWNDDSAESATVMSVSGNTVTFSPAITAFGAGTNYRIIIHPEFNVQSDFGMYWISSDCVDGSIYLAGEGIVMSDQSGPGCIVNTDGLSPPGSVLGHSLGDYTAAGTLGGEVATKADLAASVATDYNIVSASNVVYGSETGTFSDTYVRDNTYWEITEDATNGMRVELTIPIPADHKSGVFGLFGRYEGQPSNSHFLNLWILNEESATEELIQTEFIPGGNTSDSLYAHEYYERHINRTTNSITVILIHNETTHNASHKAYFDYIYATSIDVTTAADIAAAVMASVVETGFSLEEAMRLVLASLAGKVSGANTTEITFRDINDTKDRITATVDTYGNRSSVIKDVS